MADRMTGADLTRADLLSGADLTSGTISSINPAVLQPFHGGGYRRSLHMAETGVDPEADWQTRARQAFRVVAPDLMLALGAIGPRAPMPTPIRPAYALSPNQWQAPNFSYDIMRDGTAVGHVRGQVSGDRAMIGHIYNNAALMGQRGWIEGSNTLGPSAVMQLREAFRRDFPDVTTFFGRRISVGPRVRPTRQEVTIPSLIAPGAGLAWWQTSPEQR